MEDDLAAWSRDPKRSRVTPHSGTYFGGFATDESMEAEGEGAAADDRHEEEEEEEEEERNEPPAAVAEKPPMHSYDVRGVPVLFPYIAYDSQRVYMERVIQSLQEVHNYSLSAVSPAVSAARCG